MLRLSIAFLCFCCALLATEPNNETRRWWSYTQALANDKMQGRETGSDAYVEAEKYVIKQFQAAGLAPAGSDGFKQPVPLHSVRLNPGASPVEVVRPSATIKIAWFRQVTVGVRSGMPRQIEGPLYFLGNEASIESEKTRGAVVVTLGSPRIRRPGVPAAPALPKNAAATLTIDNLGGPEPPIWPLPYAGVVSLADRRGGSVEGAPAFRFNPAEAQVLFEGSGHSFEELQKRFEAGETLPNFELGGKWRAQFTVEEKDFTSDNVLAKFPGSDPALRNEYVVLSAHLDGYGLGEARHGDSIYNGAFDDAAYVALLMDLAQTIHESHTSLKRSLLFCVVTGEEKGLLGSRYFAAHPTVPKEQLVADLNLDQLRPIFPLKTLTVLALKESSFGDLVRQVAQPMGIKIQEDPEPERNLLRRSDHFSFMEIGVPAVNFVFGYEKGSADEKTYRSWYAQRYHSPADDLEQPWVPEAAAKFNQFYVNLVQAVANAPERPHWSPGSVFVRRN